LQRAALLDVLAGVPGVVLDGERSDLAGRRGLALRFVGSPNLLTVIIDRRTGEILARTGPARLDEAVLFTTLYLDRGRCADTWQTTGPDHRRASSAVAVPDDRAGSSGCCERRPPYSCACSTVVAWVPCRAARRA